jgi:uncharacterized membrane protein
MQLNTQMFLQVQKCIQNTLKQGSFTRKVRIIFTLKIIVSIFVKLFLILVLHLRQFFIVRIFCEKGYRTQFRK